MAWEESQAGVAAGLRCRETSDKEGRGETKTSRRALITGGAAALGVIAAESLGRVSAARADNGQPVLLGQQNSATATTAVSTTGGDGIEGTTSEAVGAGVRGLNLSGSGIAVYGETRDLDAPGRGVVGVSLGGIGAGVFGLASNYTSRPGGVGVFGDAYFGTGVHGTSHTGSGVIGESHLVSGVFGQSSFGNGVEGWGESGTGVLGRGGITGVLGTGEATGVIGESFTGIGIKAQSDSGTALQVVGQAKFSTAGNGTIGAGQDSASVVNPAVTAQSHITVTFTGSPGIPLAGFPILVLWVERKPGTGFIIHLTRKVGQATPFTYLIVDPS